MFCCDSLGSNPSLIYAVTLLSLLSLPSACNNKHDLQRELQMKTRVKRSMRKREGSKRDEITEEKRIEKNEIREWRRKEGGKPFFPFKATNKKTHKAAP